MAGSKEIELVEHQMGRTPVYELKDSIYHKKGGQEGKLIWVITREKADGFRLPSSAEWEYAGRGGQHMEQYPYAGSDEFSKVGWQELGKPVASLMPNRLGLFDMSGNIAEWCSDNFEELSKSEKDAWQKSRSRYIIENNHPTQTRILRSGTTLSGESWGNQTLETDRIGFRVAQSAFPKNYNPN